MCPFLIQKSNDKIKKNTRFLVLTAPQWYGGFVTSVWGCAQKLSQGTSLLLFDGSLGLGDLSSNATLSEDVTAVLQGQKTLSMLIEARNQIDVLSGRSKTLNLGTYTEPQLYGLLDDLKLLGVNYQTVLIYAPPTLPRVQQFFCEHFDSICLPFMSSESIAETLGLMQSYPRMRCYLENVKEDGALFRALQVGLARPKNRILYDIME